MAIAEWNARLVNLPNATRLQTEIQNDLIANECFYRFSAERFEGKVKKWRDALSKRELREQTINGDRVVEVPIGTTLRPAFLPPAVRATLHQLGPPLEELLQLSRSYLLGHPKTSALFGDPAKSEISWIDKTAGISPITQWIRIDFLWNWTEHGVAIKLLDVNLLPGMTFMNACLSRICGEHFFRYGLCEAREQIDGMSVDTLLHNLMKWCSQTKPRKPASSLRLAILARQLHGLAIEARLCANRMKALGASECSVLSPIALQSRTHDIQLDGIVRMCRPISKHAVGSHGNEENAAFAQLTEFLSHTPVCPFFNAFLESHAWFFIWQTESFIRYAQEMGRKEVLSQILPLLPRTGVVLSDLTALWPSTRQQLTPEILQNVVIKRANSTGSQDLSILHRASSGQREEVFRTLLRENGSGWVIQELIKSQKEIFPLYTRLQTDVSCMAGYMVYGAYYSDTKYLGAHAVMTPISRKVHGGFDSFLMPTLSSYERN